MQYVLQNLQSEDMVQLVDTTNVPVIGLTIADVQVFIRKSNQTGFSQKVLLPAEWVDRGDGNYAIQFSATDFDTLDLFRYQIIPVVAGTFKNYQDSLMVVETIPQFPLDPPEIWDQTHSPPGVTPDPVYRGSNLTIQGEDLAGATSVTIGGVSVPIVSNTSDTIVVTVTPAVSLGEDQNVVVTTPGGSDQAQVSVVLDPADIPGLGMINIYGFIHDPATGQPLSGIGVIGRVLDMPNIIDGVGWTDDAVRGSTDTNGRFSIYLPRNKRVSIEIPRIRYHRVFVTPDQATANLFTEIP